MAVLERLWKGIEDLELEICRPKVDCSTWSQRDLSMGCPMFSRLFADLWMQGPFGWERLVVPAESIGSHISGSWDILCQ